MSKSRIITVFLLIFFVQIWPSIEQLVGMDLGNMYFVSTLVQQGKPFIVVENLQSKRKTHSSVSLQVPRKFGVDAYKMSFTKPDIALSHFLPLLGLNYQDAQEYLKENQLLYKIIENERKGVSFVDPEGIEYSIEEVVAMLLSHAKSLADEFAKRVVSEYTFTIPLGFKPEQKIALINAAQIAGLEVNSFISENVAASLKLQLDSLVQNSTQNILYINMGASSTKLSIIQHSHQFNSSSKTSNETVTLLAEVYNNSLNGRLIDILFANLIASKVDKIRTKHNSKATLIKDNKIAFSKAIQYAEKYKESILGLQTVKIDLPNLIEGQDYRIEVKYEEFESCINPILSGIPTLIKVLTNKGISIDSAQLIGGIIRIPKVQATLKESLPNIKINQNLDGDESISFGASFFAANKSNSFKVKKIALYDGLHEEIRVETRPLQCLNLNESIENESIEFCKNKIKSAIVFQGNSLRQTKKSVKIPVYGDFQAILYVGNKPFSKYVITGFENYTKLPNYNESEKIKAKMTLEFNDFELPYLSEVYASIPIKVNKSMSVEVIQNESDNSAQISNETDGNMSFVNETLKKSKSPIYETKTIEVTENENRDLNFTTEFLIFPKPLSTEEIALSKNKLEKLVLKEKELAQLSEAKNKVESLIYSIKDWLSTTGNIEFMNNEEYSNLTSMISDAQDKFENQPQLLDINTSKNISKKLSDYFKVIKKRCNDYFNFNDTIYLAYQLINTTQKEIGLLISEKPWITADHLGSIYKEIVKFNLTILEAKSNFPNYNKSSDTIFNKEAVSRQKSTFHSLIEILKYIEKPKYPNTEHAKSQANFTKEKSETINEEEINIDDDSGDKKNESFDKAKENDESKEANKNKNTNQEEDSKNSQKPNDSNGNKSMNGDDNFESIKNEL